MGMTGENVSNHVDEEVYAGDGERCLRLKKLQLVTVEQSLTQIKQNSSVFLVKREHHGALRTPETSD